MSVSLASSQKEMSETPATSPFPSEISPAPDSSRVPTTSDDITMSEPSGALHAETEQNLEEDDETMAEVEDNVMSLPLSKIKKIFKMDPDYRSATQGAVFATGAATELFVQYFMEHAMRNAKGEKRKKIQYKDLSTAVDLQYPLQFLGDTVPKPVPVGQALKERKINLSEADQRKHIDSMDLDDAPSSQINVVEKAKSVVDILPKGQQTLSFEPVKKPTIKKAVIHDLMSTDDEPRRDTITIDD